MPSTRYAIAVPRALSRSPYLITREDERIQWQLSGWRWGYTRLALKDGESTELGRLERLGHWWWPKAGFELLTLGKTGSTDSHLTVLRLTA